jgi:hypothetical protein
MLPVRGAVQQEKPRQRPHWAPPRAVASLSGPASGRIGFGAVLRPDPEPRPVRTDDDDQTAAAPHRDVFWHGGTRAFRTPRVLDERVVLLGYTGALRQITVIDLGHEDPTLLLTNNLNASCATLVTRYAQRMLIENGISEAVQFFQLDALSSLVGLKVDFDLQISLMASSLYRFLATRIGREYQQATAKKIFPQRAGRIGGRGGLGGRCRGALGQAGP